MSKFALNSLIFHSGRNSIYRVMETPENHRLNADGSWYPAYFYKNTSTLESFSRKQEEIETDEYVLLTETNWPKYNNRLLCAPEHPKPKDFPDKFQWCHTNTEHLDSSSDYYTRHRCKDCDERWSEELPE